MKKVACIIITHNRLTLLKECIESIRNQDFTDYDIIVVNNGSTDGTKEYIENQNDIIAITQENSGGAGGFWRGTKYACENNYEYCWLMDDDVICRENALSELISSIMLDEKIGFVCSKVSGIDGKAMNTPVVDERFSDGEYPNYYAFIENQMIKVKTATFVSILIPVKIIKTVGLPIKEYFIWGDDTEYTARISDIAPCFLACKSSVIHKRQNQERLDFFREKDPQRLKNYFYLFRNNDKNLLKNAPLKKRILWLISRTYVLLKTLVKGDFRRFKILLKATTALFFFNPEIEYAK